MPEKSGVGSAQDGVTAVTRYVISSREQNTISIPSISLLQPPSLFLSPFYQTKIPILIHTPSTVGNLTGGVFKTLGGGVGAIGEGLGDTINKTTGTAAAGNALKYVTGGVADGADSVGKGVENVGKGKF